MHLGCLEGFGQTLVGAADTSCCTKHQVAASLMIPAIEETTAYIRQLAHSSHRGLCTTLWQDGLCCDLKRLRQLIVDGGGSCHLGHASNNDVPKVTDADGHGHCNRLQCYARTNDNQNEHTRTA